MSKNKNIDDFFDDALELEEATFEGTSYEETSYEETSYTEEPSYYNNNNSYETYTEAPSRFQEKSRKPRVRRAGDPKDVVFTRPSVFDSVDEAAMQEAIEQELAETEFEEEAPVTRKKPAPRRAGAPLRKRPAARAYVEVDAEPDVEDFVGATTATAAATVASRVEPEQSSRIEPPPVFYEEDYEQYQHLREFDNAADDIDDEEPVEVKKAPKSKKRDTGYDEYLDEFGEEYEEAPKKRPVKASKKKAEHIPGENSGKVNPQEDNQKKPAKKKSNHVILIACIVVAAGILIFSGIKLFSILGGYKEGSDTYKNIENIAKKEKETTSDSSQKEEAFSIDVQALKEVNPDTKGYLYAKGVMSYPVVQGGDNSYYLNHLFDGTENSCGCLFIDCNLPDAFESRNCIIYGHNMNDGSMFAVLHNYGDEAYYQAHKEFDVFTEGHHYLYKVLSAFVTPTTGIIYNRYFSSDEEYVNFLYEVAGTCPYETEYPALDAYAKLITLSTCVGNDDEDHRFVVVLIRDHEIFENETTQEQTTAPEQTTQAPETVVENTEEENPEEY